MTKEYIAAVLRVPLDSLEAALAAFQGDVNIDDGRPRVEIMKDGTIVLNNFERYQSTPSDKKKLTGRELELWKRQQLNRLAEEYPVEAANVPAVLKVIEGSGKDNENPS